MIDRFKMGFNVVVLTFMKTIYFLLLIIILNIPSGIDIIVLCFFLSKIRYPKFFVA